MDVTHLAGYWALAPLLSCAIVALCAARMRRTVKVLTFLWAIPIVAAPAYFTASCAQGLCVIDPRSFCLYQLLWAALGIAVLNRERITHSLAARFCTGREKLGTAAAWVRDLALVTIAAWFSFIALELADNPAWAAIDEQLLNRGFAIVELACVFLYFLGQRRGLPCLLVPLACMLLGLAQYFLDLFKNTALLPSDVVAWKTAMAVSGGYTYEMRASAIACIACATVAVAALAFIMRDASEAQRPARRKLVGAVGNLCCCALCAFGLWTCVWAVDYVDDLDIELDYWDLRNSYHEHGFLVSFIAAAQELVIEEPAGYSEAYASRTQEELARSYDKTRGKAHAAARAQFERQKPSVMAIMNESYADLSLFEELHDGYTGTFVTEQLLDLTSKSATRNETSGKQASEISNGGFSLRKPLVGGWLNMSVHGGGTCNSEYEFLASSSMGLINSGMYPYQQFDFSRFAALPALFKQLGYETTGMHPNYPGNWSREFVYASMGLDTTLFVYDFPDAELVHNYVSDRATYDRALEILQSSDEPQFVVDITMQNHGGYDTGSFPADQTVQIEPDFLDEDARQLLDEFLTCIRVSDEALANLLEELSDLEEPVVVLFFGDHQPSMSRDYNDILFQGESELEHKARITKVPYFIWANYDIPNTGPVEVESSANYLASQLLEAIGAPLDDYRKSLLVLHSRIRAVNTNGYSDEDDAWHEPPEKGETAAEDDPYRQLQALHYLNIARKL